MKGEKGAQSFLELITLRMYFKLHFKVNHLKPLETRDPI